MTTLLIWFAFVAILHAMLRPRIGSGGATLLTLALVAMAAIKFEPNRFRTTGMGAAPDHPLTLVAWVSLLASIALSVHALLNWSWPTMWLAALGSFILSILAMFSIGALIFLVTCMQLAAVVALRWGTTWSELTIAILLGVLAWVAIVPVQAYGPDWLGGFGMYQVAGIVGLLLVLLPFKMGRPRLAIRD